MRIQENPFESPALLLLRLGAGAMMLTHGIPKFLRFFGDEPIQFMDFLGMGPVVGISLAIFAEVICTAFVMVGYKTRFALIPLFATMLTATFVQHWSDPFGRKELPLLYLLIFIVIFAMGPGKFSIDAFNDQTADVYGRKR